MLEEHVVLPRRRPDAPKDVALHELVDVGAEAVDDIVVVPDVELGDLAVGHGEGAGRVPADVVLEVVIVAVLAQLLGEGVLAPLLGARDVGPLAQRALDADAVVVDLVAASDPGRGK